MGFFDKLKIAERLEAMAADAGKSAKTALTPKAPFPLSISGLQGAASTKLGTTMSATADAAEAKMRSKASTLQDNTIGKVTTAVDDRVRSEIGRVEQKVDDTVAGAEKAVDDTIGDVGKTVDGGIASANKSLDAALGRGPAKDEKKDGAIAPVVSGADKPAPAGRSRSNAVVGTKRAEAPAEKPADKPADKPAAQAEPDDDMIIPAGFFDEPGGETSDEAKVGTRVEPDVEPTAAEVAEIAEAAEVKADAEPAGPEQNFDEFNDSDSGVDVAGAAEAAARERQGAGQTEDKDDDDMGLAALFGEEDDEVAGESDTDGGDGPEPDAEPEAEPGAAEATALDPEAEIEQITAEHEGVDGLKSKVRSLREKLTQIDNEARALLGGSLATGGSGSANPWLAFFAANAAFKKKKAIRDFKNDLEGKKEDEQEKKDADELKGAAKLQAQEVSMKSGKLHRSEKSPEGKGAAVDTTGRKTGSKEGRQVFVVSTDNQLYMPYAYKDNDEPLLSASRTLVDGEMRVKDGKITYLSNDTEGEQESRPEFLDFLQTLRDAGVGNFDVFEASKKEEAKATDLLEEADKADEGAETEPEPEQAKLLDVMAKSDEWKALIADRTEKLVLAVADLEGWTVAGNEIVDATGNAVDVTLARTVVDKSRAKALAKEAAEAVTRKGRRPSVDA